MRQNTSLRDEVATQLRNEILRGQYRPGERLPSERDLAERFGVNRGCVREALKTLEQLGLADIRRGGARVQPLRDASLDVLGPLLELEELPDPDLVEQLLEVLEALMAVAVRRAVERGSEDELRRIKELLDKIAAADDEAEYQTASHELIELFVEASGNLVLRLVGRGLRMRFMERLDAAGLGTRPNRPLFPEEEEKAQELRRALERRDPLAAAYSMQFLMKLRRLHVLEVLEERRAANGDSSPGEAGAHAELAPQEGEVAAPEGAIAAQEGAIAAREGVQ